MLAGRRWRIVEVDTARRELAVRSSRGGKPPLFSGEMSPPSDGVVKEMQRVWEDLSIPTYLNGPAKQLLVDARTTYDRLGLRGNAVARHDGRLLLFPWVGDRKQRALVLALMSAELEPDSLGIAVGISAEKENELVAVLSKVAVEAPPDARKLAALVENKELEKFDCFLDDELLTTAWATDRLDVASLPALGRELLGSLTLLSQTHPQ